MSVYPSIKCVRASVRVPLIWTHWNAYDMIGQFFILIAIYDIALTIMDCLAEVLFCLAHNPKNVISMSASPIFWFDTI